MLVREALAARIDLDPAFHHQRPGDQHAVRRRHRPVALVGGHVARRCAERDSPLDGIALVAAVPEVVHPGELRDVARDHGGVAAEPAAGEHQCIAADRIRRAVGSREPHPGDATIPPREEIGYARVAQEIDAGCGCGAQEVGHQPCARLLRHRVHALDAEPGVQEAGQQHERHAVAVGEPLDRRSRRARDRVHDAGIGFAMVLAPDVGGEQRGGVGNARVALEPRAGRRDEPRRERGRAGGRSIALEHEDLGAGVAGGERGDEAAGAGADDEHRHAQLEPRAVVEDYRHR